MVQPDVLYFTAERREAARERIESAPDLLVEVLSPGTARRDRGEKLALYAGSRAREYWVVDPLERQIELMVNDGGRGRPGSGHTAETSDEAQVRETVAG